MIRRTDPMIFFGLHRFGDLCNKDNLTEKSVSAIWQARFFFIPLQTGSEGAINLLETTHNKSHFSQDLHGN